MKRVGPRITAVMVLALALLVCCVKGPDPWSPSTYPLEIRRYKQDRGALGPEWKKYKIKGMEDSSFFFAHDSLEAVITVHFTCGKYQDIPLSILAEHLIFPMGRKAKVVRRGYLEHPRAEVYHLLANGVYQYHEETEYKDLGVVPDLYAPMVIDAYVVGERHCVIDIVYAAPKEDYLSELDEFHAYLGSVGVPVDTGEEGKPLPEAEQ